MSQEIPVKQDKLVKYTYDMIRYAVYNHPEEIISLLQTNGVNVPANADFKTLHAMTLKAMMDSKSFNSNLQDFLHAIAMEEQYAKFNGTYSQYANATGDTTDSSTCNCNQSLSSKILNPTTVDSLLTSGLALVTAQLQKNGDSGIKNAVAPPPPAPPKSKSGTVIGVVVVLGLGIGGYLYWKSKHK